MYNTAKILIVDDNQNIHDILERLFSRGEDGSPQLILHADNGRVALDILANNPDIDVIVLDLDMPVMDGFEALALIKADLRLQTIPVCVFSSSKDDSTKALKLGAVDYIIKPGDYQEIRIRVLNLIESKRRSEAGELAKTNFLANVSHELRTPMNGILGIAQMLEDTDLTAEQAEYVDLLEQSANDMMNIINNCLNFLQSENPLHALPSVSFSIKTVLQELFASLVKEAEMNGVTMELDIQPSLPENLIGLPDKIQLIFRHLLSNAIKFSPSGKVVVAIERGVHDDTSVQLVCSVSDTGVGIPEEKMTAVFEPFTQADNSSTRKFGGLGIGISIANRMVQMMGGAIHLENNPAGGSRFSFVISCGVGRG
ncbi:MAG: ATP-binding protein [Desulfuromonadaceae bacterium]|nr:ATP-binding protein [Desulfuromonadaceae bacterium]MDD2855315.1 ATP-binding protein [Desulfuromonadaceae bacterium]